VVSCQMTLTTCFYIWAICSAFLDSKWVQSDHCNFAVTNTGDETGWLAMPICLLFCGIKCTWKILTKVCACNVFVRFSHIYNNCGDNNLPYLIQSLNLAFTHSCNLLMWSLLFTGLFTVYVAPSNVEVNRPEVHT